MSAVFVAVAVLAFLLWFFLSPGPPACERATPLSRVGESAHRLAYLTAGSSLRVRHDQTSRCFSFLKTDDTGTVQQTIFFVFEEREWSSRVFEAVCDLLREAAFVSSYEVQRELPDRVLTCALTGQPVTMEFLTDELIAKITPALGFDDQDRFTLRVDGPLDYAIWRRLNVGHFQRMAAEQSWLLRRFAQYHLRKHKSEKLGGSEDVD